MSTQAEKYAVAMAGEYYVVAELVRRGLWATVTLGNAKRADVVAINSAATKVVVVEVKSSPGEQWIVGSRPPESSDQPWVLVRVPSDPNTFPDFFIFTAKELREILLPKHQVYCERFEAKHGTPFSGKGVVSLVLADATRGKACWHKILDQLR